MKQTKIDWCDCTINPVVGCKNGCKYCYGEKINDRFKLIPCWREPQFFPDRLEQFESKKPKSVFIDSMSDIGCWEREWLDRVLDTIIANPQHRYIALTKTNTLPLMKRLVEYMKTTGKGVPLFVGKSITTQAQADVFHNNGESTDFLSIEPILEEIELSGDTLTHTRLLIIGAETGNRKEKVIPEKAWIDKLVAQADEYAVAVFMKSSLKNIMGADFRQDKLPWEISK